MHVDLKMQKKKQVFEFTFLVATEWFMLVPDDPFGLFIFPEKMKGWIIER